MNATKTPTELTAELAREHFHYDPISGVITRLTGPKPGPCGSNDKGYLRIGFKGRLYRAHRLAWLLTYGEWPDHQIDHINGVKTDNRLLNLRQATLAQNLQNRGRHRNNKLGVKGVCQLPNGKFRAQCWRDGRFVLAKRFDTLDEAALAYRQACLEQFGVFARPN